MTIGRKILAICCGISVFLILLLSSTTWMRFFVLLVENEAAQKRFTESQSPTSNYYYFFLLFRYCLSLALGFASSLMILNFSDPFKKRISTYIPFFLILCGFSFYNNFIIQSLVRPAFSVVFNLLTIFFGIIIFIVLKKIKVNALDILIAKYMALFLITFFGIFVPLLLCFTAFVKLTTGSIDYTFNIPLIATISGVVTCVIAVMKYMDEKKKLSDS